MIYTTMLALWILLGMLVCLYVAGRIKKGRIALIDVAFATVLMAMVIWLQFEYSDFLKAGDELKQWNWQKTQKIQILNKQKAELKNSNYELNSKVSSLKDRNQELTKQIGELSSRPDKPNQDYQNVRETELEYQQLGNQVQQLKQSLQRLQSQLGNKVVGG